LLVACGGDGGSGSTAPLLMLGQACPDGGCAPGLTCATFALSTPPRCAQACGDGSCPSGQACGKAVDGSPVCAATCTPPTEPFDHPASTACENGARVACSQATPASCAECGCFGETRCEVGVGCTERLGQGEPCKRDNDCASANCGTLTGVCNVPLGARCEGLPCDLCTFNEAQEYCNRPCSSGETCNNGFACGGDGICHPSCTSCPAGECRFFRGSSEQYCDCRGCTVVRGKGIEGVACTSSLACLSGHCESYHCAKTCTSSDECAADESCVVIKPDTPAVCAACKGCEHCKTGKSVEGTTAKWCNEGRADGEECNAGAQCASGVCLSGFCGSGFALGEACTTSNQCKSKRCVGGICKNPV
jgi:hypothetical protein